MDGLERVFSVGHHYYDRIFYDAREGSYYDWFLSLAKAHAFGPHLGEAGRWYFVPLDS